MRRRQLGRLPSSFVHFSLINIPPRSQAQHIERDLLESVCAKVCCCMPPDIAVIVAVNGTPRLYGSAS
jgi:hypothetical protein